MLQTSARRWSRLSFACSGLADILGTAAAQAAGGSVLGRALAFAAAVVAAITPLVGREILSVDSEARWIRARATAEAIKSECSGQFFGSLRHGGKTKRACGAVDFVQMI